MTTSDLQPSSPAAGAAQPPLRSAGDAPAATDQVQRGRLLVVDDEVVFSGALRRLFSVEHDVTVVNHARDAIALSRSGERFHAILCDLMMPEVTGIELHGELRRIAPAQAACMIFLTGGAFSERAQRFLDEIPNPWFEKPCNLEMLRAVVREVMVRNGK